MNIEQRTMETSVSTNIPLHIAALLLPYLTPTDIFRAQRVNKHWHDIFTSDDLCKIALRTYGALSREHFFTSHNEFTEASTYQEYFRSLAIRTRNLRRGIPHQEIHVVARMAWAGEYLWCFSDNFLIYMAPDSVTSVAVRYFNHRNGRYLDGQVELGKFTSGPGVSISTIRAMRVVDETLVIEHTKEVKLEEDRGRSRHKRIIQAYSLGLPSNDSDVQVVQVTKISEFETFEFRYVDFTESLISDHSATHYTSLNLKIVSTGGGMGLHVWDIRTGNKVFHLRDSEVNQLGKPSLRGRQPQLMKSVMLLDNTRVVLAWGDTKNVVKWNSRMLAQTHDPPHDENDPRGFVVYISTFDFTKGQQDDQGVIIANDEHGINSYVTRMKDDEMLIHYGYNISWSLFRQVYPKLTGQDKAQVKVSLNLWGRKRMSRAKKHMHLPDNAEIPAEVEQTMQYIIDPDMIEPGELHLHSTYTHINEDAKSLDTDFKALPPPMSEEVPISTSVFINSLAGDGMSYDLAWSGNSQEHHGTRLMGFDLRIHNYQPSNGPFQVHEPGEPIGYHLNYSSYLKDKQDPSKKRIVPSVRRNVLAGLGRLFSRDVVGDERMAVFAQLREEREKADLVVAVWHPTTFQAA